MKLVVAEQDARQRVDKYIAAHTKLTRSRIGALATDNHVTVNDKPVKSNYKVKTGDTVQVHLPEPDTTSLIAHDIELEILHLDDDLVVVNKPHGLVVYPAAGHPNDTMMNALKFKLADGSLKAPGGPLRPGVVHRLDMDTSGVMVVALTEAAYYSLVEQFKARQTSRNYMALIYGCPKADSGIVDAQIGRSPSDRKKMSTKSNRGKHARTRWEVQSRYPSATLVRVVLDTGRTHQIRVHMNSLGHGVLGDKTYGRHLQLRYKETTIRFARQMLHAETLGFDHPATGQRMSFTSPLPADFVEVMDKLAALNPSMQ